MLWAFLNVRTLKGLLKFMLPWFHNGAVDSLQPGVVSRQKHGLSLAELLHQPTPSALVHNNISVNNTPTLPLSFHLTWFLLFDQTQKQKPGIRSFS